MVSAIVATNNTACKITNSAIINEVPNSSRKKWQTPRQTPPCPVCRLSRWCRVCESARGLHAPAAWCRQFPELSAVPPQKWSHCRQHQPNTSDAVLYFYDHFRKTVFNVTCSLFQTDSMDSLVCLLLSISVFYFFFFHYIAVASMR